MHVDNIISTLLSYVYDCNKNIATYLLFVYLIKDKHLSQY